MKKLIILLLLFVNGVQGYKPMAVDFDGTDANITYSASGSYSALSKISVCTLVSIDTLDSTARRVVSKGLFTNNGWELDIQNLATGTRQNSLQWWYEWSGGQAGWKAVNSLSTGRHFLCVTYDNSSSANAPIMYVDGVSVTVTVHSSASGSPVSDAARPLEIGGEVGGGFFDGTMYSALIYNRILTAAEIADAYAIRQFIPTYQGLVFAPMLLGSAGGIVDGGTLAAGNTIADSISGALGVPAGSPVLRGSTYLNYP